MAQILIIEDDRPFADALALTLRQEGHDVAVAANAEEGLRLGMEHCPDLIIADWMLKSRLHGGEVCRRIRSACPHVRSIIMTGYLDVAPEVGRWSEYGETVMQKPFHKGDVIDAVNRALTCAVVS